MTPEQREAHEAWLAEMAQERELRRQAHEAEKQRQALQEIAWHMQQAEERRQREAEEERVRELRGEHRRALAELDEQIRRGEIDADVGLAVRHARELMRAGKPPGLANFQAAEVYDVEVHQVARYTGKVGASVKQARRRA